MKRRNLLSTLGTGIAAVALAKPTIILSNLAMGRAMAAGWPNGGDGDYVVFANTTKQMDAGQIWDFASVTIQPGAVLEIIQRQPGLFWTCIGCKGPFIVQGTIRAAKAFYAGIPTIAGTAPDGYLLSAPGAVSNGGRGGNGHNNNTPSNGGSQNSGNGGGGAAPYADGGNATADAAGSGATGRHWSNNFFCGAGGAGGTLTDPSGKPGASESHLSITGGGAFGGGGGGGARGYHGGLIYIRVLGDLNLARGTLDLTGSPGGAGGNGGDASTTNDIRNDVETGGGGGGGAGGNGGHLRLRYSSAYVPGAIKADFGKGGKAGAAGVPSQYKTPPRAQPGGDGSDGQPGSQVIQKV